MIADFLDAMFGCAHPDYSWPRKSGFRNYVVCLECGKEFEYSVEKMRVVGPLPKRVAVPSEVLTTSELRGR